MNNSLIIVGAGNGFSMAVARKFGSHGFKVGLISRSPDTLTRLCKELAAEGIDAYWSAADAGDSIRLASALSKLKTEMGGVSVLHYNAANIKMLDILEETPESLAEDFRINIAHAVLSVQLLHQELKTSKGAVLLTGGGLSAYPLSSLGSLSIGKAGLRSLAIMLHERLAEEGIFVGVITVGGLIAPESPTHSPEILAEKLWLFYKSRSKSELIS
ncbi:hypothetical protein DYBT9275_01571 [Dyadobacter sp. CECT 9275]|uniref:Short-chain dehydrogenase n=1 Tax=Dyadobacter helix TaxID=2822344 RepID=A0A916N3J3_9BACT|nr:SDR family NAD(P)-dependent oxidoreductase [Dyadobacter sp. CECT 9275]CAG4995179.1 hypothetical protein DYBT9275_01571 [Dyadobacter sp. CECT 9275]